MNEKLPLSQFDSFSVFDAETIMVYDDVYNYEPVKLVQIYLPYNSLERLRRSLYLHLKIQPYGTTWHEYNTQS